MKTGVGAEITEGVEVTEADEPTEGEELTDGDEPPPNTTVEPPEAGASTYAKTTACVRTVGPPRGPLPLLYVITGGVADT